MSEEQFLTLLSEIKVLSTKIKFLEDDLQEVKQLLINIQNFDPTQEESVGNWKVEKL